MKKSAILIFLILNTGLLSFAQTNKGARSSADTFDRAWLSAGLGISSDFPGYDIGIFAVRGEHCFSVRFNHMEEFNLDLFGPQPDDSRDEVSLAYGRCLASGNMIALAAAGVCLVNSTTYQVIGWYSNDPDNWFDDQAIYQKVNRSQYGLMVQGQVLWSSKYFGLGPGFTASFTGEKGYLSAFLDIAIGNLR